MRQAKQQSQDLHRTGEFIHALLNVSPGQEPPKAPADLFQPPPPSNVDGLILPKEHISLFSQPPAPPPQQPLPEKPDNILPSMSPDKHLPLAFKRIEAEKSIPVNGKTDPVSSQILQLVEALSLAKREIDSQGSRVRELEEELSRERRSREHAEEQMRTFLEGLHPSNTTHSDPDDAASVTSEDTVVDTALHDENNGNIDHVEKDNTSTSPAHVQERLDSILQEMRDLKDQMEKYKRRAENAEEEKSSLADMVEQIRAGNVTAERVSENIRNNKDTEGKDVYSSSNGLAVENTGHDTDGHDDKALNGSANKTALHHNQLKELAAHAMSLQQDDKYMQSAPYVSIVGVVLIGVGIMAYLNGWQKLERS
jgi:hypothetical protein